MSYQSLKTGKQADGIYGEISVTDNLTSQAIPNGATYTKLTIWDANGNSEETTPDEANGQITLPIAGTYKLEATTSLRSGTANVVVDCAIFIDGVIQEDIQFERKISVAGDVGSASVTGFATVTANQVIDLRIKHDNGLSVDITVSHANLNCQLSGV
jgi:hypothetical protein